ncbi:Ubiquitin carboxyl-terminal hydrolase 14, partial [Mucuna pruriens]
MNLWYSNKAKKFFLHFLDQVERANAGKTELDPSRSFKFSIEDRILCSSGKVTYNRRYDYILSLNIPLHEATNKGELESIHKLKAEKLAEGKEINGNEIVRPRVPLEACLVNFLAAEEMHDFYSTSLKTKTTALKTAGLTSFPDYLVLHMQRFVMEAGWVPKKLDAYIDVPDIVDIGHMCSKGHQSREELLPDGVPDEEDSNKTWVNEEIVLQLVSMGFNHLHCQKAAINTSNVGVEETMNWLLSHMDDPDI